MTENWQIVYRDTPRGVKSYSQEALLTLGNGYLGWRGTPLMNRYNADHYPGLYVAGIFNQTTTKVNSRDIVNEDPVNFPNPQLLKIKINETEITVPYDQRKATLDMHKGKLTEELVYPVDAGHLFVKTTKVCDPVSYHRLALKVELSLDFSAQVGVEMIIDGKIKNQNVARYRKFNSQEFKVTQTADHILQGKTLQSNINFAVGAKTTSSEANFETSYNQDSIVDHTTIKLAAKQVLDIKRVMAVATDYEDPNYLKIVKMALDEGTFEEIYQSNLQHWSDFWKVADIEITSDDKDIQKLIRLNIFQLHQAAQKLANPDLDASVGSRGLTGEGYRGHIFWDALFFVPYYTAIEPETARALMKYRIKRLPAARRNAELQREHGAMYPWQSASIGDEQAQLIHLNPMTNEWYPDNSRLQRHVSLAVVYDIWSYTQMTGDNSLLKQGGLNVLLQTSKFWLEKAEYDGENYHLSGVMGPDEFHEAYPNTNQGGLSDNAYTNMMVAWSLSWLLKLPKKMPETFAKACEESDFDETLIRKADEMAHKLKVYINDQGIIEQYNHYFELKDLNLVDYEKKYGDIHRIDRILTAENKSANDYQVDKQADSLMMIYNLGPRVMEETVKQLGNNLPKDWLKKNRDYYLARTVHGSTVSRPVYASVDIALGDVDKAWQKLQVAIRSDYDDIQGGTTADGIHTGVMGAVLTVIMRDFAGVKFVDGKLNIDPQLPSKWQRLSFTQKYCGVRYRLTFEDNEIKVKADHGCVIKVHGHEYQLEANKEISY